MGEDAPDPFAPGPREIDRKDSRIIRVRPAFAKSAGTEPLVAPGDPVFDDLPFRDILEVLSKPALAEPDSRQLVMDYARRAGRHESSAQEHLAADALALCLSQASLKWLADMVGVTAAVLSNFASRRRPITPDVCARGGRAFGRVLVEHGMRLQMARDTLIADVLNHFPDCWSADDAQREWWAALAGQGSIVALCQALGDLRFLDPLRRLPHPDTGSDVVLTLAHVWDKRPEQASLLNLAALCQRCHNRHDAADRLESRRRRHLAMLMRQGQIPLCLSPADSLVMALYDELVRKGVVGMPPQREFQMSFPAAAWEWVSAGTAT